MSAMNWGQSDSSLVLVISYLQTGCLSLSDRRGAFTGAKLKTEGLPIDLAAGVERCAAFWVQEKTSEKPQVLYADSAIRSYKESMSGGRLTVELEGVPGAVAEVIVYKPVKSGIERRAVTLDEKGSATAVFDEATVKEKCL